MVFTVRSYGDFSSWHWSPGLGGLVWGYDPLFLRYSFWFLSTTHGCGPAHSSPLPLLPVSMCFFFNSVVVWLPFSLISDGSEWWSFHNLVVILMWLCKEASCIYLFHCLNQKSKTALSLSWKWGFWYICICYCELVSFPKLKDFLITSVMIINMLF